MNFRYFPFKLEWIFFFANNQCKFFFSVDVDSEISNRALTPEEFKILRQLIPKIMDNFEPLIDNFLSENGYGISIEIPKSTGFVTGYVDEIEKIIQLSSKIIKEEFGKLNQPENDLS